LCLRKKIDLPDLDGLFEGVEVAEEVEDEGVEEDEEDEVEVEVDVDPLEACPTLTTWAKADIYRMPKEDELSL
jgi:hypothetical protein